jgi:hypothetical protein
VDDTYPDIDAMYFVERVEAAASTLKPATGNWYALAAPTYFGEEGYVYARFGGYSDTFPKGGYTTSIDIYLDTEDSPVGKDIRFDWSSAINNIDGEHRRDFIFNVGTDGQGGFVTSASNNAPGGPANPDRGPYTITTSGWCTFEHRFHNNGNGVLAVKMRVLDAEENILHAWTLKDPEHNVGSTVGGNRYGWLVVNQFSALALDNVIRSGKGQKPRRAHRKNARRRQSKSQGESGNDNGDGVSQSDNQSGGQAGDTSGAQTSPQPATKPVAKPGSGGPAMGNKP